jgi:hypothetical protein
MLFIAVFGVMYITKTTDMATRGYMISDLENTVLTLKHDTKRMDVDIAYYKSMKSIQERLSKINLVSSSDITYLTSIRSAVALK